MRYNIVFHPSWWNQNVGIDFSERFWNDPKTRIEADQNMRRALYERFGAYGLGEANPKPRPLLGSDMLACGFLSSQILGCTVEFCSNDAPQVLCLNMDEEAALALQTPDFDENPVWQGVQRQIDALKGEFGYVESYLDFNGVQNLALDLLGQELFLDYYDEDSPAEHVLDVCYETTLQLCRRLSACSPCFSGGVSNIVKSILPEVCLHSNCSVEMISQQTYEQWLLRYDQRLSEEFPVYGIHHCGQSMEHVVDAYAKVRNLRLAEVGAFSDLARVAAALPPNVRINARYSPVRLAQVSSAELHADLEKMVQILPEPRLSISCVGIDASVSDERVGEFCAYCRELLPD